eukprot:TRINITY_DN1309_c0_g1_i1.p1 TRINITY_DN1309_c0_g1~~TRINITY_DN1309_c0_g1_i1.p1  ORF type:complete len:652 (-),score=171.69 TRINITY_DN1309_c0_g1_i1:995-2950(-)
MSEFKFTPGGGGGGGGGGRFNVNADRYGSADDSLQSVGSTGLSRQPSANSVDGMEMNNSAILNPYSLAAAAGGGAGAAGGTGGAFFFNPNPGASLPPGTSEITAVRILQDPPVENCELRPFVLLRDHKGNQPADMSEEVLRYKWFRGQKRVCSLQRCTGGATIQCILCLKLKKPPHLTFFCSGEHFAQAWPTHKELHTTKANSSVMQDLAAGWINDDCEEDDMKAHDDPKKLSCRFPPPLSNIWAEVSNNKRYTPRSEDVGRMLRLEISTLNKNDSASDGSVASIDTSSVLPEPEAPPARQMFYTKNPNPSLSFKAFTYNILADMYATRHRYPYCPLWSLLWTYRRNNILREILNSGADIIGLQEVQADHFDDFLYPKLKENGYEGIYKKKTRTANPENPKQIDGCAIFYKEDKFALNEQYSIEYNEAARQHVETQQQRLNRTGGLPNPNYQSLALKRLCKGNIALVVVLEDISVKTGGNRNRRKRRLCIANTHIFWDPEYSDVKLWQTLVLCQELEKLVLSRNLPLIICGDFNSTPTSAVYQFLRDGQIPASNEVFDLDEYHVLPPPASVNHRLPLSSAYGEVSGEAKYTNYTGDYVGVLDYIFYTTNQLKAVGVLKVDDEQYLREYTALPSPRYPSDHIPLLAEFEWPN